MLKNNQHEDAITCILIGIGLGVPIVFGYLDFIGELTIMNKNKKSVWTKQDTFFSYLKIFVYFVLLGFYIGLLV